MVAYGLANVMATVPISPGGLGAAAYVVVQHTTGAVMPVGFRAEDNRQLDGSDSEARATERSAE